MKKEQSGGISELLFEENLDKYGFSAREIDVVRLMRQHYNMQEIGERLFIAPSTVAKHAQNAYYKAEVKGRIELMRKLGI